MQFSYSRLSKLKQQVPLWRRVLLGILLLVVSVSFVSPATLTPQLQTQTESVSAEVQAEKAEGTAVLLDHYEVTSITDGDTIKVLINNKTETVRLVNMNTPETVDPRRPVECMGKEASEKMSQLVSGKKVRLEIDETQTDRDRYGRLLRFVFLEDGTDVGLEMIAQGFAESTPYGTSPHRYLEAYKTAQTRAQEQEIGLWSPDACATSTSIPTAAPKQTIQNADLGEVVKKSTSDICHAPGSTNYEKTTNYTAHSSVDECLESGGRLSKR